MEEDVNRVYPQSRPSRAGGSGPGGILAPMRNLRFLCILGCVGMSVCSPLWAQGTSTSMSASNRTAQPSTSLVVRGAQKQVTLSAAELSALPQTSVTVTNAHTKQEETYSGPQVAAVLAKAGVVLGPATTHDILHSYVVAKGTDGYFVVFSGAELQDTLHKGQFIVALTLAGQPLAGSGAFQLIDSLDVKPARWVRNLDQLAVIPVTLSASASQ